jgi:hypothetical protein
VLLNPNNDITACSLATLLRKHTKFEFLEANSLTCSLKNLLGTAMHYLQHSSKNNPPKVIFAVEEIK